MAKQAAKVTDTLETVKPYLERALRDDDFRKDLRDALSAARELYGPLSKGDGIAGSARVLATDEKAQEQLRRTIDDLTSAAGTLQGKKKSHKARKMVILAGVIAGALYNPWTGAQTREKLLDMIAGNDDLEPLETFGVPDTPAPVNGEPEAVGNDAPGSPSKSEAKAPKSEPSSG